MFQTQKKYGLMRLKQADIYIKFKKISAMYSTMYKDNVVWGR